MRTFEIEPQTVVHDLHPGYLSTTWAKEWADERGLKTIAVQHHHAHVAGCMAEQGLTGAVIGLALDGTGYGTDGHIWGGEVLIGAPRWIRAVAASGVCSHAGRDAAVKEPWRMRSGHCMQQTLMWNQNRLSNCLARRLGEVRVLRRMVERGINSPMTSSLGRLFDAVAAVVLNRRIVDYEAQAAIELEGIAVDEKDRFEQGSYVPELHTAEEGAEV